MVKVGGAEAPAPRSDVSIRCYRFIGHEHNEHDKLLKLYLFLSLDACLTGVWVDDV
jgi:hypothetical protein